MPRSSSAVVAATVVFFVGFALAMMDVVVLLSHKGRGLTVMATGPAMTLVASWPSPLHRPGGA